MRSSYKTTIAAVRLFWITVIEIVHALREVGSKFRVYFGINVQWDTTGDKHSVISARGLCKGCQSVNNAEVPETSKEKQPSDIKV